MREEISGGLVNRSRLSEGDIEKIFCLGATPQQDAIAREAHRRFLERGGARGLDLRDWLDAERETLSFG